MLLVAHSRELEVVDGGFCLPSTSLVITHPAPPPFGGALHTKEKQKDQTFGQGMSCWDWDEDWELLPLSLVASELCGVQWSKTATSGTRKWQNIMQTRGVKITEKGFDGKRYLEEVLGSKCSMKCSVGRS